MRRVLIFILLFGGGLALLVYLSKEKKQESKDRLDAEQGQIVRDGREDEEPFVELPDRSNSTISGPGQPSETQSAEDDGSVVSAAVARGELSGRLREDNDRKNLLYDFHFDDAQPRGDGFYDVVGITVNLYNPETDQKRTTLVSEKGVVKIERDGQKLTVGESERVQLVNAVVTLHEGSPMAPIDLYLPVAEADLGDNSFYSDALVRVEGEGLFATGEGLIAEETQQRLVLDRNGYMRFSSEGTDEIELFASPLSTIEFRRTEIDSRLEKVEVHLPKGGRLITRDEEHLLAEGDDITLNGSVFEQQGSEAESGHRAFHPEYARLVGNVEFSRDRDRVSGGVAQLRFDATGALQRLEMSEKPVATGVLDLEGATADGREPTEVRISGLGPMTLDYKDDSPLAQFELPGPAEIAAPGAGVVLNASAGMEGNFWGRGLAYILLRGEVDGSFREMSFSGSEVELRGSKSEDEDRRLFLETQRPSHLEGSDDRGNPVDLRTEKGLQAKLDNGKPFIVLGQDVTLELIDQGLWTVSLAEVRNLDIEQGTFTAGGGVVYSGPAGSGTAVRAVGHSREHLEFFGAGETPATYDVAPRKGDAFEVGLLRAQHIDLDRRRARAETRVELRFKGGEFDEEIDCEWFELRPMAEEVEGVPTPFEFEARDISRALLRDADSETRVSAQRILGSGALLENQDGKSIIQVEGFKASGKVDVDYKGKLGVFRASGDSITWSTTGGTRLEASPGERVEARGRFQEGGLPYVLTATWIEYVGDEIQALFPEITLDRPAALPQLLVGRSSTELHSGEAEWMTADESGLLLSGNAHFRGENAEGEKLDLYATSMHVQRNEEGDERSQGVQELVAWDGFELVVGDDLLGRGEILQVGYQMLRLEGRPARFDVHGFVWESDNIEYDVPNVLVTTDQGRLYGAPGSTWEDWTATYESLQPFDGADATMMVMRNPVLRRGDREIRAAWSTFWLDRQEWLSKTEEWLSDAPSEDEMAPFGPEPEVEAASAPTIFGSFDAGKISKVLKEMYFEGDVVYSIANKRVASMEALYVDLVDGHGWIQDCELSIETKIGRIETDLIIRADWLRHSADGSLSADFAEVTACNFADPHYFIRTKNLRLKPLKGESSVWDVTLKDNGLIFDSGLRIPLPKVHYKSDSKGRPTFSGLGFGDSARYGNFVEASLDVEVGETASEKVASVLGVEPDEIDGSYRIKASYYNARGLLLDQSFKVTAADKFWMNMYLDGLYDHGEDRGMMRYKEDKGGELRWIFNTQSRYLLTGEEWVDFVLSTQSDPGVQAEFTEKQFVRYERRDTYVRWRKAQDQNYYSANVRYRANGFRNDYERLPDLGAVRGLTPFAELWGQPLLYGASADAVYLRRLEGSSDLISPFDPVFNDGLGDRDVLRGDTRHRIETPFELGIAGARLSPFASFAGTAWSEGVDPSTAPTRAAVIAGAEVQSSFFKTWSHGVVNSITPFAGYRGDLIDIQEDGEPVRMDAIDDPLTGKFFDLGVRARWRVPGGRRYLDTSIRAVHAEDVPEGEEEGWLPVQALGELLAMAGGIPFAITHEGHYDLDEGNTPLTFTSLSVLPHPQLGVEVAYNRGLDQNRDELYDAVSLGARWDATPKWHVEGRQTISRKDNASLSNDFVLRRIGHDFVFELSYGYRSGEGGSSLTFKYRPLLGWRSPNFGSMQTLQNTRL